MKIEKDLYNNLINISYSIIIAGFIIIFMTTGSTNINAVTALISGYSAILVAFLFFGILTWINMNSFSMILTGVFIAICSIILMSIIFLSKYFDRIVTNKVSEYYYSFSNLSTLFLAVQLGMIFFTFFNKKEGENLVNSTTSRTFSFILLLSLINIIIITILGIVLNYYYTQG